MKRTRASIARKKDVGSEKAVSQSSISARSSKRLKIPKPEDAIMIGVSAGALFDTRSSCKLFEEEGTQRYIQYMVQNEKEPLAKGNAFAFVSALANVNRQLLEMNPEEKCLFDVVLLTNNSAQVGVRLIRSINHYGLNIERACFTGGSSESIGKYLAAYETDLYLSTNPEEVKKAIECGIGAATIYTGKEGSQRLDTDQLRIAFDGDATLFNDEAEIVAKEQGLEKFFENETKKADIPLGTGPMKRFAMLLGSIKKKFKGKKTQPIRVYLITARGASSSGERALITLRSWGLEVDEALFLSGAPKGPLLEEMQPHLFFDDSQKNIDSGLEYGVNTSAHVPYGISQVIPDCGTGQ